MIQRKINARPREKLNSDLVLEFRDVVSLLMVTFDFVEQHKDSNFGGKSLWNSFFSFQ